MKPAARHLTDRQLVALHDGELPHAEAALQHLAGCAKCSSRQQQLSDASHAFQGFYRNTFKLSPALDARLRLQHAMQTSVQRSAHGSKRLPAWSFAVAAILLVAASLGLYLHHTSTAVHAAEIPNGRLTPGMTRPVILDELCSSSEDTNQDPAVTPEVQRAVLREYGLNPAYASDYQIDYLINPQLGGTSDVRNLWPEPYRITAWNARAKDALESRLHLLVCHRQLDLAEAQRAIATDWIAAYKKYMPTASRELSSKEN